MWQKRCTTYQIIIVVLDSFTKRAMELSIHFQIGMGEWQDCGIDYSFI